MFGIWPSDKDSTQMWDTAAQYGFFVPNGKIECSASFKKQLVNGIVRDRAMRARPMGQYTIGWK
jgi:hypothetical protein